MSFGFMWGRVSRCVLGTLAIDQPASLLFLLDSHHLPTKSPLSSSPFHLLLAFHRPGSGVRVRRAALARVRPFPRARRTDLLPLPLTPHPAPNCSLCSPLLDFDTMMPQLTILTGPQDARQDLKTWAEAARHFVWLLNRTEASAVDGMTSHEAVFGRKPNLQSVCQCVCVFVCAVKPVKQVGGEAPRRGEKGHTQDEKGEGLRWVMGIRLLSHPLAEEAFPCCLCVDTHPRNPAHVHDLPPMRRELAPAKLAKLPCLHSTTRHVAQPIDRVMSRQFFEHGEPIRSYFQDPVYTLARPLHPTAKYIKRSKAPLNVVDAGTFLHVGYRFSECGKCACADQRGEAHELAVWLTQTQTPNPDADDVDFAKRANVAWVVFSKLGSMAIADLEAWMSFLAKAGSYLHCASLLSILTFLPADGQPKATPTPPPATPAGSSKLHPSLPLKPMTRVSASSSSTKTLSLFIDVSSTTYALYPKRSLSLSLPPTPADLGLSLSFIPELGPSSPTAATPPPDLESASLLSNIPRTMPSTPEYPHPLPLRPLSTTLLVRIPAPSIASTPPVLHINLLAAFSQDGADATDVPQLHTDITKSYHELLVLSAARWRLAQMGSADPILPILLWPMTHR
ncbi:hypothetical protein B0H14DRAFT_3870171 [Mycena olivaceomarginata]|nr:hypothetical protein B0H14DRAFT_3870171 [Mycena olivaceomarginata]